jgi:hypothetical protein
MKTIVLTLALMLLSPIFALPTIANPTGSEQAASDKYEYQYADGAGNLYIINPESIDYRPISRAESSSLNYDGGAPRQVKIDPRQYQSIAIKLDRALNLKSIDVGDGKMGRAKGMGLISKQDKQQKVLNRVISMGSQEQKEIEALLRQLIGVQN